MSPVPLASARHAQPSEIADVLRDADDILVVSHHRPDGDCIGSAVALSLALMHLGKRVWGYNASPLGTKWDFVEGITVLHNTLPPWKPALTVFVDCGAIYRVSDEFRPEGPTINIDHHTTNEMFADLNWVDVGACAVGEQVHELLGLLGVPVTRAMANALFLAILTDTGGFRFSNTTARAFAIAGSLVAAGASPGDVSQAVWESRPKGDFLLTGKVYSNLHFEEDDILVWAELRQADYALAGGADSEPEGLSTEMRSVRGVEVSCLLHETPHGTLRANFRGKGNIDCSAIATACGGGGHFNASGAHVTGGTYEEARERVLATVRAAVRAWRSRTGR